MEDFPNIHRLKFNHFDSRRNFPRHIASKRGESNFLRAFERNYLKNNKQFGITVNEFALQYYGRADLVWMAWNPESLSGELTNLELHRLLRRRKIIAFEAKLKDWKKGIEQAFRYRYFADKSILVMPTDSTRQVRAHLDYLQKLDVGLWGFDKANNKITKYFTPNYCKPYSKESREKAIALISGKINLRTLRKKLNAIT